MKKEIITICVLLAIIVLLVCYLFGCTIFSATCLREDAAQISSTWFQGIENEGGDDVVLYIPAFTLIIRNKSVGSVRYAGRSTMKTIEIDGKRIAQGMIWDPMIGGFEFGNYVSLHYPGVVAMPEHWKDSGL